MPLSLAAAADDLQRLSWTLRRKPLESFLAPQAAVPLEGGAGALVCRDGSLVSLLRLDGARSMMGAEELDRFVDLAARRLNTAFGLPGHALHMVFERAPDEARPLAEAHTEAARRQGERLGLDLGDLLGERSRRLAPLIAVETLVLACWTRPCTLPRDRLERDRKRLRKRLRDWLPEAGAAQCPHLALEGLWPRHEALLETLGALLAETGIAGGALGEDDALRLMRRMVNGAASTAPDWRPVTAANDAPARLTEPPEEGAFPPPLASQLLIREPQRIGAGIRIGERLYGALDMSLGPRRARPFLELMAGLSASGLPCRFSLLIEGGGLHGLGAAAARIASSFLAFSSSDSLLARNAFRDLAALAADAHAIVRLRLGLLTWVAPEDEAALPRRLSRLQQIAEGWGEAVFTPLVGDALESVASSVPGFCCGATAEPALVPLTEALRLLPVSRPAPLSGIAAESGPAHLFRSPDGKPLPFAWEDGGDYGFELIYGLPGQGKSVLMNSLGLAFCLARRPGAAALERGDRHRSVLRRAGLADPRGPAAGTPPRGRLVRPPHDVRTRDQPLRHPARLPRAAAGRAGLPRQPAEPDGDSGRRRRRPRRHARVDRPGARRRLCAPFGPGAGRRAPCLHGRPRSAKSTRRLQPPACACRSARSGGRSWICCSRLASIEAAARAQRYAVPVLGDLLASVREPAVQGLVGNTAYGGGGETVTQAFIRILTALSGDWPVMFAPTAFDIGGARIAAVDLADVAPQGSAEADRQSAAFYLLARHALTRHWWIGEDALAAIPEPYRDWHAGRLRGIREAPKRLCYDEFHRTAGAPAVRAPGRARRARSPRLADGRRRTDRRDRRDRRRWQRIARPPRCRRSRKPGCRSHPRPCSRVPAGGRRPARRSIPPTSQRRRAG